MPHIKKMQQINLESFLIGTRFLVNKLFPDVENLQKNHIIKKPDKSYTTLKLQNIKFLDKSIWYYYLLHLRVYRCQQTIVEYLFT